MRSPKLVIPHQIMHTVLLSNLDSSDITENNLERPNSKLVVTNHKYFDEYNVRVMKPKPAIHQPLVVRAI